MLNILGTRRSGKTSFILEFLKKYKGEKVIVITGTNAMAENLVKSIAYNKVKNKVREVLPISRIDTIRGIAAPILIDELSFCLNILFNNPVLMATDELDQLTILRPTTMEGYE